MNGPSALVQGPNNAGNERLTIGAGITVDGLGNFLGDDGTCTNEGLVNADVSGATLTVQPDPSYDFTNSGNGYAEATNGGTLQLLGAHYTGNSFRAMDGSKITLNQSSYFTSTTLSTSGTGELDLVGYTTLTDVTLNGKLNDTDTLCVLAGTLTNNGTINLMNGADIQVNDAVTLAGTARSISSTRMSDSAATSTKRWPRSG